MKIRQENGSARLNFRVNKWDIVVNLGNNAKELAKMIETLELVKNDSDVTITQITLHGYASPDGGYANNDKLSRNRTQALKDYLTSVYPIDQGSSYRRGLGRNGRIHRPQRYSSKEYRPRHHQQQFAA